MGRPMTAAAPAARVAGVRSGVALLAALFVGGWGAAGRRRRRAALSAVVALALTIGAVEIIGRTLRRSRPFAARPTVPPLVPHNAGRSFPSRHAACAAAMTAATLPTAPRFGWLMGSLGAILSLSRVYAGLHYPSDVLGGWLLGISAGLVARGIRRRSRAVDQSG